VTSVPYPLRSRMAKVELEKPSEKPRRALAWALRVQKRGEKVLILPLCASQMCDRDVTQYLFGRFQKKHSRKFVVTSPYPTSPTGSHGATEVCACYILGGRSPR
jgi:hypothetical protein